MVIKTAALNDLKFGIAFTVLSFAIAVICDTVKAKIA